MPTTRTDELLDDAEQLLTDAVRDAFDEYFRQARAAMLGTTTADASPADLPPNLEAWPGSALWDTLVRRFVQPAIGVVFDLAFESAARSDIGQIHRHRTTYMEKVFNRLSATLWPNEAFDRIRGDLVESIDIGDSITRMRERVAEQLNVSRFSYLAERIARTEAHTAVEGGSYSASLSWEEASGEELYQQWIATPDNRVRPDHLAASGQIVRLGEPFNVGGYMLMHPGDPDAPPEAVIQCRCSTLTGTWDELQRLAPSPADTYQGAATMSETAPETETTGAVVEPVAPDPVMFRGPAAPLGTRGDYRMLATPDGGQVPTNDKMWLSYQERSSSGHDGKIAVGRIDRAWVHQDQLWIEGVFDIADSTGLVWEVVRKIRDGFAGTISVDLSDGDFELVYVDENDTPITPPEDLDELWDALDEGTIRELVNVTNWRLGGATLVQDPAFHTASIEIIDDPAMVAAATGDAGLPLADRDHEWDGPAALSNLQEAGRLADGCFWRDADADDDTQADYRLPFADIIDGTLTAIPAGIFSVAGVLQGAMGGVDIPQSDHDAVRDRVAAYYARMRQEFDDDDIQVPWESDEASTVTASAEPTWHERVANATPVAPPTAWFTNPKLTGLTKVQVSENGRVYGHIADWRQRHIGMMGEKVYPPRCPHGGTYPRFHRHPVRTAEGTRINTGPLATAGHAPTSGGVTMSAAMAHYDDPRFVVANVVTGEDEFGIWVAGALRPGVEAWQVAFLDTYAFSGDWRFQELVAACSVSVEGFFVPNDDSVHALAASAGVAPDVARVRASMVDGETVALVSAGVVAPPRPKRAASNAGVNRLLQLFTEGNRQVMDRMDSLPGQLGDIAYRSAMQAMRDDREFSQMAATINQEMVAEALAMMED